ncbi:LON peptidase substrate-binding domain-containing protein [Azohydromonas caseinilytica]|uniref:Peptidase S16 n=1 Tax=Azohydromonas caseinilytica TaxID=2728836 RepID=A0A848F1V8_9BURK|nr:LON peptidase substrate-binding domain-containing protein [Azohydromonas caseinilytica]NML13392.1 peptidase S16 [Azohydromonas caseinilytica]
MTTPGHGTGAAGGAAPTPADQATLPLFPLQTVLYPGGLLPLKIFEARYLDMVGECLRTGGGFGVVCLRDGAEVRRPGAAPEQFEHAGVLARLDEVDAPQPGILLLRCIGTRRFTFDTPRHEDDGLWVADVNFLPDDPVVAPGEEFEPTAAALSRALEALETEGLQLCDGPPKLDDAGWVANRWCELLPLPLSVRQKLMLLPDPLTRLRLVDDVLRQRGLVTG